MANIIDVSHDGEVPSSQLPYKFAKPGAFIKVANDNVGPAGPQLTWSNVRDILLGLREYMVVLGHRVELGCIIKSAEDELLGYARVLTMNL